jgi:hypothetical protein
MIWVYYSAQIFLLGAEFTWVYAHEHGSRKGEMRPGAVEKAPTETAKPVGVPGRIAPAPMPAMSMAAQEVPVHKRKPLVSFGIAAAVGAVVGFVYRTRPDFIFHRSRPRLFSRLKLH